MRISKTGGLEVAGSNPVAPTILFKWLWTDRLRREYQKSRRGNNLANCDKISGETFAPNSITNQLRLHPQGSRRRVATLSGGGTAKRQSSASDRSFDRDPRPGKRRIDQQDICLLPRQAVACTEDDVKCNNMVAKGRSCTLPLADCRTSLSADFATHSITGGGRPLCNRFNREHPFRGAINLLWRSERKSGGRWRPRVRKSHPS